MSQYQLQLPDVGDGRAVLLRWLVSKGQDVAEDQALLHLALDGEEAEIVSPVSGRILSLDADEGDEISVGGALVTFQLGDPASTADAAAAAPPGSRRRKPAQPAEDQSAKQGKEPPEGNSPPVPFDAPRLFPAVDFGPLSERLEALDPEAAPEAAIEFAQHAYEDIVVPSWARFAETADLYGDIVNDEEQRLGEVATSAHAKRVSALDAARVKRIGESQAHLDALKKELPRQLEAGGEVMHLAWSRVGRGLELSDPVVALAKRREAEASRFAGQADTLARLRTRATGLPATSSLGQDPAVTRWSWWLGLPAAVLGGLLFHNAFGGLVIGVLTAAGVIIWRKQVRSRVAEQYNQLLTDVARNQVASTHELARRTADLEAELADDLAQTERQKASSANLLDSQIAAARSAAEEPRRRGQLAYEASAATCAEVIATIERTIRKAVDTAPDLFEAWDRLKELPEREAPLGRGPAAFRIGDAVAPNLATPRLAAGPPGLAQAGPRFWRLGGGKSLLLSDGASSTASHRSVTTAVLARILHQLPSGSAHLTLFDPFGLGRSFAPFLKLGDVSGQLISGKVCSNTDQMRRKLKDLLEHVERVTQNHLRDTYNDVDAYNADDKNVPEPYRFLVVEDYPECFDEDLQRDLLRVLQNGPRCGVYALIHANTKASAPRGASLEALRPFCQEVALAEDAKGFEIRGVGTDPARTRGASLDPPPADETLATVVKRYGDNADTALKVKVPYRKLLAMAGDKADQLWERSSVDGISVPLGPSGKKVQHLTLGVDLAHHALLVGRPGSGKSNLLHVFITTAARLYPPSELQFYLIDFKQGVEFKPYAEAGLPHAHVIAVQSEREFGLSVLQGLEATMGERGKLFAAAGVNDIASYRMTTGEPMPRIVLVIDEFQEFFVRDDRIKREAAIVMARLVSQARYSGIHLFFGTQSLATATLDRAIRDQMTVRIALQCSEADSRLILADDNTAARLLTRPGEAIYNTEAGRPEGNNQFQVAMFSDDDRQHELRAIAEVAMTRKWAGEPPIIFAGHEPGDIETCRPIAAPPFPEVAPSDLKLWLGASTSLRPLNTPQLKRLGGRNLLVLTRDEAEGVGVMMAAMMSLAVQCPPQQAAFRIVDLTAVDADWADHPEEFADAMPHDVQVLGRHQVRDVLAELDAEIRDRMAEEELRRGEEEARRASEAKARRAGDKITRSSGVSLRRPPLFFVLLGIHRARDLKAEGVSGSRMSLTDSAPVNVRGSLGRILKDGPEVGVHTLIWCDAYANLERVLDRQGLAELGIRVSGPLSDQESRRLFDDESAATLDKAFRMVLGDDDRVGVVEVFRPYGLPTYDFINQVARALSPSGQEAAAPVPA